MLLPKSLPRDPFLVNPTEPRTCYASQTETDQHKQVVIHSLMRTTTKVNQLSSVRKPVKFPQLERSRSKLRCRRLHVLQNKPKDNRNKRETDPFRDNQYPAQPVRKQVTAGFSVSVYNDLL